MLLLAAIACGHSDAELRNERAQTRQFREAYEAQAQELAALKAKVAEMEKRDCK
ncbi:MAG TPA: hypothetical protein VH083_03620 [Myxococcales bacterium]|nr:hypothetical protein [Myxococcales bacterium]